MTRKSIIARDVKRQKTVQRYAAKRAALKEDFQLVESDLYLSNIPPLGVPFNNLIRNTKDNEKISMADKGKRGSPCTIKHHRNSIKYHMCCFP